MHLFFFHDGQKDLCMSVQSRGYLPGISTPNIFISENEKHTIFIADRRRGYMV